MNEVINNRFDNILFTNIYESDDSIIDIILPTINEEINILVLLEMLSCKKYHKIIIDDSIENDTINNILKYNELKPVYNLTIIKGDRKHLGGAYKKASKYLLGSKVIIMDSDLSHNPDDIRKFLWIAENTSTWHIITGTRYKSMNVKFNQNQLQICPCCKETDNSLLFPIKEPENGIYVQGGVKWPFFRKFISSGANVLTALLTGGDFDFTGSFRLYKREVLIEIINNCPSNCFSFQMEALCYAIKKNMVIKECPIIFYDRMYGYSKIGPMHIMKFLKSLVIVLIKNVF